MRESPKRRSGYPSDVSDAQWELVKGYLDCLPDEPGPQRRLYERRAVLNAILYRLRTGCQWRFLPNDLPDWQTVFHYFQKWSGDGTIERLMNDLRAKVRAKEGRSEESSAAIMDSQSVKAAEEATGTGFDAGKRIKGRKRHPIVDVLGLLICVLVTSAGLQDRDAVKDLLPRLSEAEGKVTLLWADAAYRG